MAATAGGKDRGGIWRRDAVTGKIYLLAQSGQVYEVSEASCSCPHFRIHHTDCKHMKEYQARGYSPQKDERDEK